MCGRRISSAATHSLSHSWCWYIYICVWGGNTWSKSISLHFFTTYYYSRRTLFILQHTHRWNVELLVASLSTQLINKHSNPKHRSKPIFNSPCLSLSLIRRVYTTTTFVTTSASPAKIHEYIYIYSFSNCHLPQFPFNPGQTHLLVPLCVTFRFHKPAAVRAYLLHTPVVESDLCVPGARVVPPMNDFFRLCL